MPSPPQVGSLYGYELKPEPVGIWVLFGEVFPSFFGGRELQWLEGRDLVGRGERGWPAAEARGAVVCLIGIKSGCYEGSVWFSIKSARDCFFYIDMYLKKLLA